MEKQLIQEILENANIQINGSHPGDIQIHNDRFYDRVFSQGSIGLGESYMDKDWDCEHLDVFFDKVITAKIPKMKIYRNWKFILYQIKSQIFNYQSIQRAKKVMEVHYDLGNDLFVATLGKAMNYSCGFWENAQNAYDAQQNKMELICQKLMLKPGMKLLDIGCGFGSFAKYAAENYQVEVDGITLSSAQKEYADKACKGLPINIKLQDYRDLKNCSYDRIASIGMFEHVGRKNHREYMEVVNKILSPEGIFLLHTIGANKTQNANDPWSNKYIFPGGCIPSISDIGKSIEELFVLEDLHNFGADYAKTLVSWNENFRNNWKNIEKKYDERFYRMWTYHLLSAAGSCRARDLQLWQVVLTKNGLRNGFQRPVLTTKK